MEYRIIIAGDYCPRMRVGEAFANQDFSCLAQVKPLAQRVDYALVNFECPIVEETKAPIVKYGPALKTDALALNPLLEVGFHGVTLANNHFRDYGDGGCLATLAHLKKVGLDYVGGGSSLAEAQSILYKEIRGHRFAFVNFCEHEFSIATTHQAGAAPMDLIDNYKQIVEARQHADYVVVIVHGGHEMYQLPSPRMKKLYRFFVDLGADAVVNHHQHCYSGYEFYQGKPIVYGLGNFCFDSTSKERSIWNEGYLAELIFDDSQIRLLLHPYVQCHTSADVQLLQGVQKMQFEESIRQLNAIIQNDDLLQASFDEWVKQQTPHKMKVFASFHNRYLNYFAGRGWIPWMVSQRELLGILNHVDCEAHRDITIASLKNKISSNMS